VYKGHYDESEVALKMLNASAGKVQTSEFRREVDMMRYSEGMTWRIGNLAPFFFFSIPISFSFNFSFFFCHSQPYFYSPAK
jgi:hypothetical protein